MRSFVKATDLRRRRRKMLVNKDLGAEAIRPTGVGRRLNAGRSADKAEGESMAGRLPYARGWPLVGKLPDLFIDQLGFLTRARERYGEIYRIDLGIMNVVALGHPRHVQHVFVDRAENYRKLGGFWESARNFLGNGLVVSEGDFWLRQRRMMQPEFHGARLANLTTLMVDAISESLDLWRPDADGAFDLVPAFGELTIRTTTRALFGVGVSSSVAADVGSAGRYVVDYILRGLLFEALPRWLPMPGRKEYQRTVELLDRSLAPVITAARSKNPREHNLLSMMIDAVDGETGDQMTDQQLRDEVKTLFLAGFETTALTLAWAFELLCRSPAMMRRLEAEVESVLGDRRPTFADLRNLPFARMVVQETLRLRPSAWQVPRVAVADDEIDGYRIPAGSNVVALIYACHHHPGEWPDPERFDPERFLPERTAKRHKLAYMPFGAGQRQCIGRDFALMEGQLAIAMVAQRYRITPIHARPARPQFTSTLHIKGGVAVRLTPRTHRGDSEVLQ